MPSTTSLATPPTHLQYPSENLTLGAGVAVFHLATSRVIVCHHTRDNYYFLPKGRKNANEPLERAAEREGFEESGYRNRLLPLPMRHRATDGVEGREEFVTEPLWMQLLPLTSRAQYTLFWFVGETVPEEVERSYRDSCSVSDGEAAVKTYTPPPPFPKDLKLRERIAQDTIPASTSATGTSDVGSRTSIYEPVHHANTAQDEEEMCYRSYLMPVAEARRVLKGSVMEDVVRRGWKGIQLRMKMEEGGEGNGWEDVG